MSSRLDVGCCRAPGDNERLRVRAYVRQIGTDLTLCPAEFNLSAAHSNVVHNHTNNTRVAKPFVDAIMEVRIVCHVFARILLTPLDLVCRAFSTSQGSLTSRSWTRS